MDYLPALWRAFNRRTRLGAWWLPDATMHLLFQSKHDTEKVQEGYSMNTNEVYVELTENVDRIEVKFRYSEADVAAVKRIRGRRWDPDNRFWTVPMDMKSARALREWFGERMKIGPALRLWAKEQVKMERNLRQLNAASDAKLERTPKVITDVIAGRPIEHPSIPPGHALRRKRPARPYQRADIKMMSMSSAINANDVGTGKTLECI